VKVREAIARLPEAYRTVLMLRDVEELDTGEAAAILDVTPNAVKTRLHRARPALRMLLAREFAPAGERPCAPCRRPSAVSAAWTLIGALAGSVAHTGPTAVAAARRLDAGWA
jgi:hypothetical protein